MIDFFYTFYPKESSQNAPRGSHVFECSFYPQIILLLGCIGLRFEFRTLSLYNFGFHFDPLLSRIVIVTGLPVVGCMEPVTRK